MTGALAHRVAKQINASVKKQTDYVIPSVMLLNFVQINS